MKLSNLEKAPDYDVREWLEKELELTPYQKEKVYDKEIIRFAPFYFYQRVKPKKVSFLWRITIIFYIIYIIAIVLFLPFKWIFTGTWGYGSGFIDNFHSKWVRKIGLKN
jgi:hypothetical protein